MRRRLGRWRARGRGVIRDHPFLLSLIVLLSVVIPAFIRVKQITDQLHATQHRACVAGNEARGNQIDLWTYIIKQAAEPPRTAAERARIAAFEKRLHEIFAPRHCV